MNLTAIISCKDRVENLAYCLGSINVCNPTPKCVLVDFGNIHPLQRYAKKYSWLSVVRVDKNTELFHKTRAMNIGVKAAKTDYVCLTDVDQIFQPNFFGIVLAELRNSSKVFVRCKTYFSTYLPPFPADTINWLKYRKFLANVRRKQIKDPHGEGCCHGVSKKWLISVRGHDEKYIGWGYEDKDLVLRASAAGYNMVWVDNKTSMVHLPHKRDKNYFRFAHISKNKARFEKKREHIRVKANNTVWGMK